MDGAGGRNDGHGGEILNKRERVESARARARERERERERERTRTRERERETAYVQPSYIMTT